MSAIVAKHFKPVETVRAEALPWLADAAALRTDNAPQWIKALRDTATESFTATALPTAGWEDWQYTNQRPLHDGTFTFSAATAVAENLPAPLLADSYRIVLVNGQLQEKLSHLPKGATLTALMDLPDAEEELITAGDLATSPFVALNTAYMRDGFVLDVPKGTDVDRPIEILYWHQAVEGGVPAVYPRSLIRLGENSGMTVLERHAGAGAAFTNHYTGIVLKPAARLRFYRFIDENDGLCLFGRTVVRSQKSSVFEGFSSVSGLAAGRQEFRLQLLDPAISSSISGIYMLKGRQSHDFSILADHFEPDGTSEQHFKGVIDDQSRAVFQGKIHVHRPAQKTDGYQSHHALLLSDQAEACAKPELEIYADDVKCSHGATSGMLDTSALFYMQSRGIPEAEARALLIQSFLGETLEKVSDESVRALYAARIAVWLGAESAEEAA
jgi:Fe-S cluster assembly protein SufD